MTITDCSRATGICIQTISNAIRSEELEANRTGRGKWYILPAALLAWSKEKWNQGRCSMFPLYYTAGHVLQFHSHELSPGVKRQFEKEAAANTKEG